MLSTEDSQRRSEQYYYKLVFDILIVLSTEDSKLMSNFYDWLIYQYDLGCLLKIAN